MTSATHPVAALLERAHRIGSDPRNTGGGRFVHPHRLGG